jgi:hypothetical protein
MEGRLVIVPVSLKEAQDFILSYHRHNKPPVGHKFSVGVAGADGLVGVAIVGRPVARGAQDGSTLEVLRVCVAPNTQKGACSMLYQTCWRAAKAMGYQRLITYTLQSESGASLRGAGWKIVAELAARNPKQWQNRQNRDWQSVVGQSKIRWEATS